MKAINEDLIKASENGHLEVVKVLLQAGANVHARHDYSLRWAFRSGHSEIVELLQKHLTNTK